MAKRKIEVSIEANEQASSKVKEFNKTLDTTRKIADAAGSSYDRMSALSNRLQLNTLRLADAQRRLATETDPLKQAQLRVEIDNLAQSQDVLQKEIHESSDAISDMGDSSKGVKVLGLSLTDLKSGISLVTGAARTMAQVTKQAFDFTEEGAAVIQTRESFDRLGVSIEAMREVSLNTIDDMTLMKSTLTLTAGASEALQAQLLQNAPQLLKIAKAANAVNPNLGTTAQMYESIATGIKRGSPLILDNLGIVVKVGEANEIYAQTLGKTAEQLTAAEKQMALLNATVIAGDRLIEQAGGTVESYGDAWAQLRVEVKNTTDEMKANSAEAFGPFISNLADGIQKTREYNFALGNEAVQLALIEAQTTGNNKALQDLNFAYELATQAQRTSGDVARIARGKHKELNDELELEIQRLTAIAGISPGVNKLRSNMSTLTLQAAAAASSYNDVLEETTTLLDKRTQAQLDARKELEKSERLDRNNQAAMAISANIRSDLTERLDEGAASLSDLRQQQSDVNLEIEKLTASHGRAIITQEKATMTAAQASLVTLQLADAQAKLAAETDDLKAARLAVQIEKLQEKLGGAAEATTTFINNTKKISELKGAYDGLTGDIEELNASIRATINNFMIQQLQARLAIDGWTGAENELFLGVAVGLGLMDQAHADLVMKIDEVAEGVDAVGESEEQALENAAEGTIILTNLTKNLAWETTRFGGDASEALRKLDEPTQRETLLLRELALATEENNQEFEALGLNTPPFIREVEKALGHAVEQAINLGNEVVIAQDKIDDMKGKSITIDVQINTHGQRGAIGEVTQRDIVEDINQASGGDYLVNKRTLFVAGEGPTPERAIFIPQGRKGFDGAVASQAFGGASDGTRIGELNIFVNGTADAQETARLVILELQGRALMPQTPLR